MNPDWQIRYLPESAEEYAIRELEGLAPDQLITLDRQTMMSTYHDPAGPLIWTEHVEAWLTRNWEWLAAENLICLDTERPRRIQIGRTGVAWFGHPLTPTLGNPTGD